MLPSSLLVILALCALHAQAQDTIKAPHAEQAQGTIKAPHAGLASEAPTKGKGILGACPPNDFECADGNGCCPITWVCGTGSQADKCLNPNACPAGDFVCSDGSGCCPTGTTCASGLCIKKTCPSGDFLCSSGSGCCPYGKTCGTGSQSNLCLASPAASSSLPPWAISLIVFFPLACLAAACHYQIQKGNQPPADAYSTFNPVAQAPAPQPAYQVAQTAYQGPSPTYQSTAPPAYQGSSGPQQWR